VSAAEVLAWLLEPENPSVRYLALTDLLDRPVSDSESIAARAAMPGWGPAKAILAAQWPEGYWMRPGVGYSPKYKATVWQVIFLAALGAPRVEAVDRACAYVLGHSRLPDGRFSAYKTAKGATACLNGNLLRAMLQLGCDDHRLKESLDALVEMVTRDEYRCRFNSPDPPAGRMRDGLPCAWGAIKALSAFAEVSPELREDAMCSAIDAGIELLLSGDLVGGGYATATRPSPLWQRFGFPLGYTSDLLEALEVLGHLGKGCDPRLSAAIEVVRAKRDELGRWRLEHTPENTWGDFGRVGQPNKWVTLRGLRALKACLRSLSHSVGAGAEWSDCHQSPIGGRADHRRPTRSLCIAHLAG
jgi:hypothetical protein